MVKKQARKTRKRPSAGPKRPSLSSASAVMRAAADVGDGDSRDQPQPSQAGQPSVRGAGSGAVRTFQLVRLL